MSAPHSATRTPAPSSALEPVLAHAPHRIGKVTLVVHDLDRLARFYQTVLGLEVIAQDAASVTLGAAGTALLLLRQDKTARARSPRDAGLFHTAFLLPGRAELGAWLTHAAGMRVPLQGASDHLVSEAVYLADPEGNGIEVYTDRPPEDWPRRNGEIQMATDAMDVQGVLGAAASAGLNWAGFPAGGTVGHLHLQVGALAQSDAFYATLLGFDIACRYPGASFYGSGGYHHQLAGNIWNSRGAPVRPEPSTGLAEFELLTRPAMLDAIRARLPEGAGKDAGHNASADRLVLRDPWGTAVALVAA